MSRGRSAPWRMPAIASSRSPGSRRCRPAELATLLADAGLQAIAVHQGIEALRSSPDAVADRLAALGTDRLIVPWMPEDDRVTADDVRRFADELNGFASVLAPRGVRLGYHNHAFEFEDLDGTTVWDVLLERLGQEVDLEVDVYWAAVGGRDPATLIGEVADRVRLLHMKDLIADADPQRRPGGAGEPGLPVDRGRRPSGRGRVVHRRAGQPSLGGRRHHRRLRLPRLARRLTRWLGPIRTRA